MWKRKSPVTFQHYMFVDITNNKGENGRSRRKKQNKEILPLFSMRNGITQTLSPEAKCFSLSCSLTEWGQSESSTREQPSGVGGESMFSAQGLFNRADVTWGHDSWSSSWTHIISRVTVWIFSSHERPHLFLFFWLQRVFRYENSWPTFWCVLSSWEIL